MHEVQGKDADKAAKESHKKRKQWCVKYKARMLTKRPRNRTKNRMKKECCLKQKVMQKKLLRNCTIKRRGENIFELLHQQQPVFPEPELIGAEVEITGEEEEDKVIRLIGKAERIIGEIITVMEPTKKKESRKKKDEKDKPRSQGRSPARSSGAEEKKGKHRSPGRSPARSSGAEEKKGKHRSPGRSPARSSGAEEKKATHRSPGRQGSSPARKRRPGRKATIP